jgi:hypothetical protein
LRGVSRAAKLSKWLALGCQSCQADKECREAGKAKAPEKHFGEAVVAKLLCICQASALAALPQLWLDLPQAPKKQGTTTTQQAFGETASQPGMAGSQIPTAPDIAAKICSLGFEMTNGEGFGTGLHPFTFGHQDQEEATAAREQAKRCHRIDQGQGAPALAEVAAFLCRSVVKTPKRTD